MKKLFFPIILIFLLTHGFCGNGGKIAFEETQFDFGTVFINQKVVHVFKFSNIGTTPLEITKVEAPCGCTSTLLSNKKINPGEHGKLEIILNTGSIPTTLVRRVYVHSSDTEAPIVKLIVKANVQRK